MPGTIGHIEIDLETRKALEANRESFEESLLDILKRILGISENKRQQNDQQVVPRQRHSRKRDDYLCEVSGAVIGGHSLKETLKNVLLALESKQPGFIERLAAHRTVRGRRIVARKPQEIYPGNPELAEQCAERLDTRWWYDTNISFRQTQKYLDVISTIGEVTPRLSLAKGAVAGK